MPMITLRKPGHKIQSQIQILSILINPGIKRLVRNAAVFKKLK